MNSYTPFGNYFTGTIDEVQVYNRALASNEISTVYAFSGGQAANTQTSTSTGSTGSTSVSGTPGSNNGTTQGGRGSTTTQTQGSGSSSSTVPSSPVTPTSTATQLPSGLALRYHSMPPSISGNTVADVSGNNMNGTIQGTVKVVSGQSGQALQFNGTNAASKLLGCALQWQLDAERMGLDDEYLTLRSDHFPLHCGRSGDWLYFPHRWKRPLGDGLRRL